MYLTKTPNFIQFLFPDVVWKKKDADRKVYLTFDDGPIPEVTPWVLAQLKEYEARATFFCIGENVAKHNDIFKDVVRAGHAVGNHTYHHLNGWKTPNRKYYENIEKASQLISGPLFRPPYGKISFGQYRTLCKIYSVVMWDVISYDFDRKVGVEQCIDNVMKNVSGGSVVVFHDSLKAWPRLEKVLPKVLKGLSEKGFIFEKL